MTNEYNLDRVGKKMPYQMPEGFFEQMQANVLAEVEKEERAKAAQAVTLQVEMKHRHKAKLVRLYVAAASIAASVCLAVLVGRSFWSADSAAPQHLAASVASVDKAYDNLSNEEQQELNATYANDVYLCME